MQVKSADQESTPTSSRYTLPLWMQILAPIVAVSAALGTAYSRIQTTFYKKTKHEFGVRELSEIRYKVKDAIRELQSAMPNSPLFDEKKTAIGDLFKTNMREHHPFWGRLESFKTNAMAEITALQTSKIAGSFQFSDTGKAISRIEDVYTQHMQQWIAETGYAGRATWKGIAQRVNHLGSETRFSILFTAAISAGASLLGFFMLRRSNELQHEMDGLYKQIEAGVPSTIRPANPQPQQPMPLNDNTPSATVETQGLTHAKHTQTLHPHATRF